MSEQISNFDRAQALSLEYGGIANIPDDKLREIGYTRRDPDNRGYISPIGLKPKEIVIKTPPFEILSLELQTSGTTFRRIEYSDNDQGYLLIRKKLNDLEQMTTGFSDFPLAQLITPELERLVTSLRSFMQDQNYSNIDDLVDMFVEDIVLEAFIKSYENSSFDDNSFLPDSLNADLTQIDTAELYQSIERASGTLKDTTLTSRIFETDLSRTISDRNDAYDLNLDDNYLRQHMESTLFVCLAELFQTYLVAHNFPSRVTELVDQKNPQEVIQLLSSLRKDSVTDLVEQEKSLKSQIKLLDKTDRPRLQELNEKLKNLEHQKANRQGALQGMIDFYQTPTRVTKFYSTRLREIQDLLINRKAGETKSESLILDARPDPELDRDPGAFSGDCTAGKPLPFDNPNIPVFNVKVMQAKDHIGNIYLLESLTKTNKTVWHLEAIQIPSALIDWSKFTNSLISSLAECAAQKAVDLITVNGTNETISNYDYIAESVMTFWQATGQETTEINIPMVKDDRHTPFQGNGQALVLWKNS